MSNNTEVNEFSILMGFNGGRTTEVNTGEDRSSRATEVNTGAEQPSRATEVNTGAEQSSRTTEVNEGDARPARATEVNAGGAWAPVRATEVNDEGEETPRSAGRHTEVNDGMQVKAPFPEYAPGDTLQGSGQSSYEIIQKIDKESGEAVLYRAKEREGTKEYAIKIYRREKAIKDEVVHELMETKCPYLPKLYEVGKINQYPYEVMKFYSEGSLEGRTLSLEEIKKHLLPSMNEAFHVLHEANIIHQDIKPSNIMKNGDSYVVMDFGISGVRKDGKSYVSQVGGFSKDYLPPYDLSVDYVSAKWDYYSLGITLFELFTGHLPYAGMDPQTRMKVSRKYNSELGPVLNALDAPDDFKKLLDGLSRKIPESRWGHAQVQCWLEGKPVVEIEEETAEAVKNELNPPYNFEKHAYTNLDQLMEAMAQQWETGKGYLFRGYLRTYMEKNDRYDLATLCADAAKAEEQDQDKAYANWLYSMADNIEKLYWKENSWTLLEFGKVIFEQLWNCEDNYSRASEKNFNLILEFLQTDVLTLYCNSQSSLSPEHAAVAAKVKQHMEALKNLSFGEAYCRELYALAYTLSGKQVLRILGKSYDGYAEFMAYLESLYQDAEKEEELKKLLNKLGIAQGKLADDKTLELQFSCWLKAVREQAAK